MSAAQREILREAASLLLSKETIGGEELRAIVTRSAPAPARPAGA